MHFEAEQVISRDWQQVHIGTVGVDADLVDDLRVQLEEARLTVEEVNGGVVVRRTSLTNPVRAVSVANGVFSSLRSKGFQVSVSKLSL